MSDVNNWNGSGNVGNPEVKDNRIQWGLAVERWNGSESVTQWIPCTLFCKPESIHKQSKMITKGTTMFIQGELVTYKDQNDVPRFGITVRSYRIGKYGQPKEDTNQDATTYAGAPGNGSGYTQTVERQSNDSEKDGMPW